ncbi:MAG: TrkA family potassium uptake protein [Haloarculaceae archaeon]
MYVIVVGAGRVGSEVIDQATAAGHDVVVIEADEARAREIKRTADCLVLNADATDVDAVAEADPEKADALVATTADDATNLMVMLVGRDLGVPTLVSVVQDPQHMPYFEAQDVTVFENPQELIAEHLLRRVEHPTVTDYLDLAAEAEVFEAAIQAGAPVAGASIERAAGRGLLPADAIVVAIERDGETIVPRRDAVFEAGDVATVFSQRGATDDVVAAFETG